MLAVPERVDLPPRHTQALQGGCCSTPENPKMAQVYTANDYGTKARSELGQALICTDFAWAGSHLRLPPARPAIRAGTALWFMHRMSYWHVDCPAPVVVEVAGEEEKFGSRKQAII